MHQYSQRICRHLSSIRSLLSSIIFKIIMLLKLSPKISRHYTINRFYCMQTENGAYPPIRVIDKDRYRYFIDSLRFAVKSGSGGNGMPKYGGIGGKGGNVYVQAVQDITLKQVRDGKESRKAVAGIGQNSSNYKIIGAKGKDCIIKAPIGVTIISETGRVLGELNNENDKVLVALGGKGGDKSNNFCGSKGQKHCIILDLKLIADAGFVGFPNAGKSTLLKAISRAAPKIANYPFTTLTPNIGIMQFEDLRSVKVADLPGLIEGAHLNIGLGHKFLKHIVRTKVLVFVIDINGFRYRPDFPKRTPIETFLLLNKELELYDETVLNKPAILVITKIDNDLLRKKYDYFVDELYDLSKDNFNSIEDENLKPNRIIKFEEIIPVCSKTAFNIPQVRQCIRDVIDLCEELNRERRNEIVTYRSELSNQIQQNQEEFIM